jgi:hypothetical protein
MTKLLNVTQAPTDPPTDFKKFGITARKISPPLTVFFRPYPSGTTFQMV